MTTYQGMTELPEATERALCALTAGNLLALLNEKRSKKGNSHAIAAVSDTYMMIQEIARRWDAAELAKELADRYTYNPDASSTSDRGIVVAPAMRIARGKPGLSETEAVAPKAAGADIDVPRGPARPTLPVKPRTAPVGKPTQASLTAGGTTTLQPSSKRSQIVARLKALGGSALIEDLDKHLNEPTLPHLKKLVEAGWVNIT